LLWDNDIQLPLAAFVGGVYWSKQGCTPVQEVVIANGPERKQAWVRSLSILGQLFEEAFRC
jgi:hypothetical protein